MSVPEQTPYREHTGNGVTASFSLGFICESKDHLIVLVDEIEPPIATWNLSEGNVVFTTAPEAGRKITLQRNTPFGRTTNYQSFNNSFRPQAVNSDFDRVWWKIQELGVRDWLLDLKLQKFRDDVNLTALENTLEEASRIYDDTVASVIEVQDNVVQSQALLANTTAQANAAALSATSANSSKDLAKQYVDNIDGFLTAITGGHKAYATLAGALFYKSTFPMNSIIEITLDGANNGAYYWNGADLTKSDYDPLHQAKLSAASLTVVGDYLTETSKREIATLNNTDTKYLIVKAIKKVAITNPVVGKKYKIDQVSKNIANFGSRIYIKDETDIVASISIPATTVVAGVQKYETTTSTKLYIVIDWDVLADGFSTGGAELFFDNDKYFQEYTLVNNTDRNTAAIEAIKPAFLPDWIVPSQVDAILDASESVKTIVNAIKGVSITGAIKDQFLRLSTVSKQDATYGSRFLILDPNGTQVLAYSVGAGVIKTGIETVNLTSVNSSGLSGTITIDWDELAVGFIYSTSGSPILIKWNSLNNSTLTTIPAIQQEVASTKQSIEKLNSLLAPNWLKSEYLANFHSFSEDIQKAAKAIKGVEVIGAQSDALLSFSTVGKNHPTFASRFIVLNSAGTIVSRYDANNSVIKTGIETVTLAQVASSGISINLTVDWDQVPQGLPISGNYPLYIDLLSRDYAKSKLQAEKNTNDIINLQAATVAVAGSAKVASKACKVAIAGSSITWGGGYLGEQSYVGTIEQILRNQYAKTIHASTIATNEATLTGNDFYQGSIKRIGGLNKEVSFSLDGDELSLSIARERENTGACLVELYVDNVLYDTFDTSTKPSVSRTENFTGNGSTIKFNLDGCFTYDHAVTVGGVLKAGKVNTQGSGASIPASDDYMIIRRYDGVSNRVVHVLWFKEAPTGAIVVTYKQGENIRHLKGTIDRSGAGFTSTLESTYGDGSTSYDPANPSAVSSGFGFRESDNRSVKTWKFSESKTRSYKLKIKALHSSATGATPYLDLNFVTNRMHHIMNAGIGGWEAREFISSPIKINMIDEVINFNPDIVLIESCTNDDFYTGVFKAHVVRSGLTAAQILAEPTANYFTAISGTASNKTVNDVRIPMTAITSNTITLAANVVDVNIAVGDVVVIGDYGCNHQRVAVRVIKAYDSATKTITLNRSISADEFYQAESLSDLLPEFVMIYNAPTWADQNDQLVEIIESALPDCKINIATAGIPHFYLRKLFGYREIAQKVAKDNHIGFVDYYDATFDYQYSQQVSTHQTITSTGASEYTLTGSAYTFPNPKVFVNGVEHKRFRITGGLSKHWASNITDPSLNNTSNATKSFKLIFDADIPASGAIITIHKSTIAWAGDYCHPIGPQGFWVLGQAASKVLKDLN